MAQTRRNWWLKYIAIKSRQNLPASFVSNLRTIKALSPSVTSWRFMIATSRRRKRLPRILILVTRLIKLPAMIDARNVTWCPRPNNGPSLLIDAAFVLDPSRSVMPVWVVMGPVNCSALFVPLIFAVKLYFVSNVKRNNSRRQVNVMCNQECLT